MYEKMEQFLAKQYDRAIADPTEGKTFFDQAFGGLIFAIQMCGDDWDESDRYIDLWDKVWRPKFIKAIYNYDAEV